MANEIRADTACACNSGNALVFACSGGSNVGQIANIAALELDRRGVGRMYCLIGVSAHLGGMVDSAAGADYRIVIDGCAVACARKAAEHAGIGVDRHVVATELGIAKNHVFEWTAEQVTRVVEAAQAGAPVWRTAGDTCCGGSEAGCGCH
ncbi:MAG: putative zinc-binding protein [Candidatus Roseilinea sp.]|uniref:putative zinc-binding protein n=1 Tax=Candidatus Roseilinea sp. TaxID=2838777 RepID=UPI00404B941B